MLEQLKMHSKSNYMEIIAATNVCNIRTIGDTSKFETRLDNKAPNQSIMQNKIKKGDKNDKS